jgi:hypothetical protein
MEKTHFGKALLGICCFAAAVILGIHAAPAANAADEKTGIGLTAHVLNAYQSHWKYCYGCYGQLSGGVRRSDCAGLIKSYLWWTGDTSDPDPGQMQVAGGASGMLQSATVKGSLNSSRESSLPRIHGLILYGPGHVGVYVGNNMEVDNRCTGKDIQYEPVFGGRYHWQKWFKLPQIQYPESGIVTLGDSEYYYENGQYVVSTQKTIGGTVCSFDKTGKLVSGELPDAVKAVQAAVHLESRVLQKGQRGEDVRALQKDLTERGYMTANNCTGYYGPITKAAVLKYQSDNGLPCTGMADAAVLKSLGSNLV